MRTNPRLLARWVATASLLATLNVVAAGSQTHADVRPDPDQIDLLAPPGSEYFGVGALVLPNGNYVALDRAWDDGGLVDVGAVWLYDGHTNEVIQRFTGATAGDGIGAGGVHLVGSQSDFVIVSPDWDAPGVVDAGAVTQVDGDTGVAGDPTPSIDNSLIGSTAGDRVGDDGIVVLENGNYVVRSSNWDDGAIVDVGAVTWVDVDGTAGTAGEVSTANSFVGVTTGEELGSYEPIALTNGNYVVRSLGWDDGILQNVGAATWADGTQPLVGSPDTTNSLHGTAPNDQVGRSVVPLTNGNYVVTTTTWDWGGVADAGAVTWADGTVGTTGPVTAANSLHGSLSSDRVGKKVVPLANGNYVIASEEWDNGIVADAGAVTWADGNAMSAGPVDTTNSLYGTGFFDYVGNHLDALTNGNYVARTRLWDNGGVVDAGAATWGDGTGGTTGAVSAANSLVGTDANDQVGSRPTVALSNGDAFVLSPNWSHMGVSNVGAVTWLDGTGGTAGPVTAANSLHGTTTNDEVGTFGIALSNGHAVVASPYWSNGAIAGAGAVTWLDGDGSTIGPVTTANSLYGTSAGDNVGGQGPGGGNVFLALDDGAFVVTSPAWNGPSANQVGAVTWGDGQGPIVGAVSASNSLVGSTGSDLIGDERILPLEGGHYLVVSPRWDDGANVDAGAVTLGLAGRGVTGEVGADNSVIGTPPGEAYWASERLTAAGAAVIHTTQDRLILMQLVPTPALVGLDPARLLDTRPGEDTADGQFAGDGVVSGGTEIEVQVAGRAGVPADARAVVANLTAVNPTERGFVTLHPCGTRPLASSLNYSSAGVIVGNELIAKLSPTGSVCIFTSATTHLTLDAVGHAPPESDHVPLEPARVLDTRPGESTIDGADAGGGPIPAMTEIELQLTGRAGVPAADVAAVVMNVTAVNPSARGFVTIHPCGERPLASSLNYVSAGLVVGNELVAKLSPEGAACIYTEATTHLTADVVGYVPEFAGFMSLEPARIVDTRPGEQTIDGTDAGEGRVPAGGTIEVDVAGRAGVPASGAAAVVMNVTAIGPLDPGYVTLYPCNELPLASSLNYATGVIVGNEVVAKLSPSGSVCAFSFAATHLTFDVVGYVPT